MSMTMSINEILKTIKLATQILTPSIADKLESMKGRRAKITLNNNAAYYYGEFNFDWSVEEPGLFLYDEQQPDAFTWVPFGWSFRSSSFSNNGCDVVKLTWKENGLNGTKQHVKIAASAEDLI